MNNDDIQKLTTSLLEAMREVFPTAAQVEAGFEHVDKQFEHVDKRLDKIESILLLKQDARIEKLEHEVKELKDALAL